jgi:hypothetical protein
MRYVRLCIPLYISLCPARILPWLLLPCHHHLPQHWWGYVQAWEVGWPPASASHGWSTTEDNGGYAASPVSVKKSTLETCGSAETKITSSTGISISVSQPWLSASSTWAITSDSRILYQIWIHGPHHGEEKQSPISITWTGKQTSASVMHSNCLATNGKIILWQYPITLVLWLACQDPVTIMHFRANDDWPFQSLLSSFFHPLILHHNPLSYTCSFILPVFHLPVPHLYSSLPYSPFPHSTYFHSPF